MKNMNAVMATKVLFGVIALLILSAGALFYYGNQFLGQVVEDTNRAKVDAEISDRNLAKLQQLETELDDMQTIVDRTQQIIAESSQYQYQDQIVRDINAFAARTGVTVTGYTFQDDEQSKSASTVKLSGVKTLVATVSLQAPVKYDNFLRFLKAIEQNLTKMQVTGVNISPDQEDLSAISNPSIGLIIYAKDKN